MLKNDLPSVWRRIKATLHMLNPQLIADIEELYRLARQNRMIQLRAYDDVLKAVRMRRNIIAKTLDESESADTQPETGGETPVPRAAPAAAKQPKAEGVKAAKRAPRRKPQFREHPRRCTVLKSMRQEEIDSLRLELLEAKTRSLEEYRQVLDQTVARLGSTEPRIKSMISSLTALSPIHRGNFTARLVFNAPSDGAKKHLLTRLAKLFKTGSRELLAEAKASTFWKAKVA